MSDVNSEARRALHDAALALHEALDVLEANDGLRELDWILEGADGLLSLAVTRFEQIRYCLRMYGRTTAPSPVPLCASSRRDA